jgi:hypothetical protein
MAQHFGVWRVSIEVAEPRESAMTILTGSPDLLPRRDDSPTRVITSTADVIAVVRESNHATALAGWTVPTIAMGLVLQAGTVRAIESTLATFVLMGLLLPVLVAAGHVIILLREAAWMASDAAVIAVGVEGPDTGAADGDGPSRDAVDRLNLLIALIQIRDWLARRALTWACGAFIGFLAWSLLALCLRAGG